MSNKIQRNFKCPCNSGKKFKDCCMPKPEKIVARPAAAGGTELPKEVKVPTFHSTAPFKPTPSVKVHGAFGRPGRHRHPNHFQVITDPKFLSRAARERLHVSHT